MFRRDQIKFVEKDKDTFASVIYSLADFGSKEVRVYNTFNYRNISFKDMDQANEVLELIINFSNNIRIWENNGFTPKEIFEEFGRPNLKPLPDRPFIIKKEKVGRNHGCPCGSGKKYKKCCLRKEE